MATATATPVSAPVIKTAAVEVLGIVSRKDIQEAKYGGTIRGLIYSISNSLDPTELTGPADYTNGIFDRLLEWNPLDPTEAIPDLAESWKVDSAGKTYTFTLRKGVKWHDGAPFTSADVDTTFAYWKHAWDTYKKTQRIGGFLFPLVESYRAIDDYTFEVKLKGPASQFISIMASAHYNIYPKHKLDPFLKLTKFDPVYTGDQRPPVGTGPFKYGKYTQGVSMSWVRNDAYWRKDFEGKALPYLDGYSGLIMENAELQYAAIRTGQLDYHPGWPAISASKAASLKEALGDRIQLQRGSALLEEGFIINMGAKWSVAKQRDFRWALNLLLNRDEFYDLVFQKEVLSARVLDSRVWPAYALPDEEAAKAPWVKADPAGRQAEAKRLLDGLGIVPKDFPEIMFVQGNRGFYCAEAELAALQFTRFGFKTKVQCPISSAANAIIQAGDYHLSANASGVPVPDATVALQQNYWPASADEITWVTPDGAAAPAQLRVIEFLKKASFTLDAVEKQRALWEVQRILYGEDTPVFDLGWSNTIAPSYSYVRGLTTYSGIYEPRVREYTWMEKH